MDQSAVKDPRLPFIRGTKPSVKNSQLLISSGIPSLDHTLGGGLPVGSLFLIGNVQGILHRLNSYQSSGHIKNDFNFLEEDRYGTYAKVMLKYFLAEGVTTSQSLFIGSKDIQPSQLVSELPAVVVDAPKNEKPPIVGEQFTIAWRYQNMKVLDSSPTGGQTFGHYYDLTKSMDKEDIKNACITQWEDNGFPKSDNLFNNTMYSSLLRRVQEVLMDEKFSIMEKCTKRNVLRITIHSLGSRLWCSDSKADSHQDLAKFLYLLRAQLRYSFAVGVVTVPVDCLDNSDGIIERIEHISDVAIRLESFAGSQKETNPLFKDYHGLLHLRKMLALNTIAPHNPESRDLVFKLRRKKFIIEVLHLPPELEDTTQREQDEAAPRFGCSSKSQNLLDF